MKAVTTNSAARSRWLHLLTAIALVTVSWSHVLDQAAREHIDRSLVHAAAVFAIARGLNGFLTVAKSTEVSSGLLSFQPLEVLDPIHDLVEQFSSLMKLAAISLTIQKVFLELMATIGFKVLLTGLAAFFVIAVVFNWTRLSARAWRFLLFALMVRFLFVASILLNALVDARFLYDETAAIEQDVLILSEDLIEIDDGKRLSRKERSALLEEGMNLESRERRLDREIEGTRSQLHQLNAERLLIETEVENAPLSLLRRPRLDNGLKERRDAAHARLKAIQQQESRLLRERDELSERMLDIQNAPHGRNEHSLLGEISTRWQAVRDLMRIASLKERSEKLVHGITALMAMFLLRTILLPVLFLYLLIQLFKGIWRIHPVEVLREINPPRQYQIRNRAVDH